MTTTERRKGAPRIKFEPPIPAHFMAIDGTWRRACHLVDISDSGAQLQFEGLVAGITEFFLILTEGAHPAFRRCKLVWVNGDRMGAQFEKAAADAAAQKRKRGGADRARVGAALPS